MVTEPYYPPQPPTIREATVWFREGSYFPKELGLNMPEVAQINIGFCTFAETQDVGGLAMGTEDGSISLAHTHVTTAYEGWFGRPRTYYVICVSHGGYIYDKPGVVSHVMIHEYCHVLAKGSGHNLWWAAQMQRFGLEPWISAPYALR